MYSTSNKSSVIISILAVFMTACGGTGPEKTGDCPELEAVTTEYVIGAGDSLQVFVWRHDDISTTVPVRPDGRISIPLVEDVVAVGRTPTELARVIETQLSEYLRTPKVNIIVASQGSANQIQVVGNVVREQSVPYREGLRLLDVMVAVGGLDEFAAGNRSKIVRQVDGRATECRVRVKNLMEDGDVSQNVRLYPGDVIIVPQARF
ncbi:MAG: polysaccharide biosynthesis/export family protein [Woeseiaceae bacterium]|nr:polysaccharide biosynthesis/export family protein [Woeseiaceae bacterium]